METITNKTLAAADTMLTAADTTWWGMTTTSELQNISGITLDLETTAAPTTYTLTAADGNEILTYDSAGSAFTLTTVGGTLVWDSDGPPALEEDIEDPDA